MSESPPLWRRLLRGDVAPGWLRRGTGRDQPKTNGDQRTNGDRDRDHRRFERGPEAVSRSLMPERPEPPETRWLDRDRKPLVPESMHHPVETAKLAATHAVYVVGFHAARLHIYLGQNVLWSFRGVGRLMTGLVRWARVHDKAEPIWDAYSSARSTNDWNPYLRLEREQRDQAKARVPIAVLGTGLVLVLVFVGLANPWTAVPTVLAVVFGLGWAGRPMDRPYIESAVVSAPKARRITPDQIIRALHAAKLCKETIGPDAPDFVGAGVGRDGNGWAAVVDLPYGYTAQQAIDRRTQIAAGLRVDEFQLFVNQARGNGGHAGRIKMWIADTDPHSREPVTSPLIKAERFDFWQEIPFGVNERGDMVRFRLVWASMLIGALPGIGKSNALRLLLAAAALDPQVKLLIWDGKGGKDLTALEQVAHAFGAGEDDDVAKALVAALTELQAEMRARFKRLRALPDEVCPEGKLTPALARDPKLNMPLTVVAIDEFHAYLENRKHGKQIEELLTSLAKIGRAMGIILLLSTQRPSSKTMPTDLRDVIAIRFALAVPSREFSEMILGSGSYKAGLDASRFLPEHRGVGILQGTDDGELIARGGQTTHTHFMDLVEFRTVCTRARALREGAGTLSGVAAGEAEEALSDRFLHHVNAAFRGEDKAHSEMLCRRLAEDVPGLYADGDGKPGWDASDLAAALARYGIRGGNQIWASRLEDGEGANRKGFHRQPVIDEIAKRAGPAPDFLPDDP